MKKIFLFAALAGLLGTSAIANTFGDDKDKKAKKECKASDAKACAGEKKEGCAKGEKSCCKKKETAATPAPAGATAATEKK